MQTYGRLFSTMHKMDVMGSNRISWSMGH